MKTIPWFLTAAVTCFALSACEEENICIPKQITCTDNVYYKCLPSGKSNEIVLCPSAGFENKPFCHVEHVCVACNEDTDCKASDKHCVNRVCEPLSVKGCVDGEEKCQNTRLYTCSKKAWDSGIVCADGCNKEGSACEIDY